MDQNQTNIHRHSQLATERAYALRCSDPLPLQQPTFLAFTVAGMDGRWWRLTSAEAEGLRTHKANNTWVPVDAKHARNPAVQTDGWALTHTPHMGHKGAGKPRGTGYTGFSLGGRTLLQLPRDLDTMILYVPSKKDKVYWMIWGALRPFSLTLLDICWFGEYKTKDQSIRLVENHQTQESRLAKELISIIPMGQFPSRYFLYLYPTKDPIV